MNKITKFLIVFLLVLITIGYSNMSVDVNAGYTYSHKGKAIYSTEGLTRTQEPYRATDLGLTDSEFGSPQDMYIYTDKTIKLSEGQEERERQTIYVVDSEANNLYSWNGYLEKESRKSITQFDFDVIDNNGNYTLDMETLMQIKSSGEYFIKRIISITGTDVLEVGKKCNVTHTASPLKSETMPFGVSGEVVWSSNDTTIATVDQDGLVTAVSPSDQKATITCALKDYPSVSASIQIKIVTPGSADLANASPITGETVSGKATYEDFYPVNFEVEGKTKLSLEKKLGNNEGNITSLITSTISEINPTQECTYSSLDTTIVTVDKDGKYIARNIGKTSIIITNARGNQIIFPIEVIENAADLTTEDKALVKISQSFDSVNIRPNGLSCAFRKYLQSEKTDYIYLCDTNNNQVLVADVTTLKEMDSNKKTYSISLKNVFVKPKETAFSQYAFKPEKIVVDDAARMYVISNSTYQGIIQLSRRGEFSRFVGVNYVTLTTWDIIWRQISSEAQLAASSSILNTTFTSICIDEIGFIYATSQALYDQETATLVSDSTKMIKKINHSGKDVLYRNGYQPPQGDVEYVAYSPDANVKGPSRFSSVSVNSYGVYTIGDNKMGKLFTYDRNGNLLYISGGGGLNTVTTASLKSIKAIRYQGENLLVLDDQNKTINIFEPTEIAVYINKAVKYQYDGKLEEAQNEWQNVKDLNSNYEYAYVGIGKVLYTDAINGSYTTKEKMNILTKAMDNFEIGYNRNYYSRAYKIYRDYKISRWFEPVMYCLLGGVLVLIGYRTYKLIKYGRKEETGIGDE